MKLFLSILFLIFLFGCTTDDEVKNKPLLLKKEVKWRPEIQFYLDLIPKIELPLKYGCNFGFKAAKLNYELELIRKYTPAGATIIGLLYQAKDEAAIIYGYPADIYFPVVTIINRRGEIIRELNLFDLRYCGEDMGYISVTEGEITNDFLINTKTTIKTWDENKPIKDTLVEIKNKSTPIKLN